MRLRGFGSAWLAVLALTAVAGVEVAAAVLPGPGDLVASRGADKVRAQLGSFCVSGEPAPDGTSTGMCGDSAAPTAPPRPRLRVTAGARVHLRLADRAGVRDDPISVRPALMRFAPDGSYEFLRADLTPKPHGDRVWTIRLPAKLRGANALHVFTRFAGGGDATYYVGLKA